MKQNAGFTLMELMIVIAIVGILSSVAVPNLVSWRQNRDFTTSVQRALSVMHAAKGRAVKENVSTVVSFDSANQNFRAFVDINGDNVWNNAEPVIDLYEMPPRVRIKKTDVSDPNIRWVQFDGRGMPDNPETFVLASDNGMQKDVVVNITGRIRIN